MLFGITGEQYAGLGLILLIVSAVALLIDFARARRYPTVRIDILLCLAFPAAVLLAIGAILLIRTA